MPYICKTPHIHDRPSGINTVGCRHFVARTTSCSHFYHFCALNLLGTLGRCMALEQQIALEQSRSTCLPVTLSSRTLTAAGTPSGCQWLGNTLLSRLPSLENYILFRQEADTFSRLQNPNIVRWDCYSLEAPASQQQSVKPV